MKSSSIKRIAYLKPDRQPALAGFADASPYFVNDVTLRYLVFGQTADLILEEFGRSQLLAVAAIADVVVKMNGFKEVMEASYWNSKFAKDQVSNLEKRVSKLQKGE